MAYGPTSPLGGTRIFYSSTFTLGLCSLFYSGKMILLNLTLGSRNYFLPESHSIQVIACYTRRFRSYSPMFPRYFVPSLLQFPSIDKPLWITTYTRHSYNVSQLFLLLQDTLKFSLLFRESFELSALLYFVT